MHLVIESQQVVYFQVDTPIHPCTKLAFTCTKPPFTCTVWGSHLHDLHCQPLLTATIKLFVFSALGKKTTPAQATSPSPMPAPVCEFRQSRGKIELWWVPRGMPIPPAGKQVASPLPSPSTCALPDLIKRIQARVVPIIVGWVVQSHGAWRWKKQSGRASSSCG